MNEKLREIFEQIISDKHFCNKNEISSIVQSYTEEGLVRLEYDYYDAKSSYPNARRQIIIPDSMLLIKILEKL
mgnify:CR=1 FL=1